MQSVSKKNVLLIFFKLKNMQDISKLAEYLSKLLCIFKLAKEKFLKKKPSRWRLGQERIVGSEGFRQIRLGVSRAGAYKLGLWIRRTRHKGVTAP